LGDVGVAVVVDVEDALALASLALRKGEGAEGEFVKT